MTRNCLVVYSVLVLCAAQIAYSQTLPSCGSLRRRFAESETRLFRNAGNVPGVVKHLCLNRMNKVRSFFSCAEGSSAVVSGSSEYSSVVINIRVTGDVLVCLPDPTSSPVDTKDLEQGTEKVPMLRSCPPSSSPTGVSQYLPASRDKLCAYQCGFGISVYGVPTGEVKTRTIYSCCNGQPELFSVALKIYSCPDAL